MRRVINTEPVFTSRATARLFTTEAERLEAIAKSEGVTVSVIVRRAIRMVIDQSERRAA